MIHDLKQPCYVCRGLGFDKGKICECITKERDPLKDIFSDVFCDPSPVPDNIMKDFKDFLNKSKGE